MVRWVAELVASGRAVAVMGNHDLNAAEERLKEENTWLFGHGPVSTDEKQPESHREREEILSFLKAQPLARERGDLRVVHACWDDQALRSLEGAHDPVEALNQHRARIKARLKNNPDALPLALQNENPVKLITSGPEVRSAEPYFGGGKVRNEQRHPWWDEYSAEPPVVFGHYWRIPLVGLQKDDGLFSTHPLNSMLGRGKAICVDYSVGGRAHERRERRVQGPFTGRLAALRWPERVLVFDDGEQQAVRMPAEVA